MYVERLSMTFVFPANGKNSTFAVFRLAFVRWNEQVCVCHECVIFSLFFLAIYFKIR